MGVSNLAGSHSFFPPVTLLAINQMRNHRAVLVQWIFDRTPEEKNLHWLLLRGQCVRSDSAATSPLLTSRMKPRQVFAGSQAARVVATGHFITRITI